MTETKLNYRFEIPLERIEETLKYSINGDLSGYDLVIAPRDLICVSNITFMTEKVLEGLIRNIPLRNEQEKVFPYANSEIRVFGREPKGLDLGQTFVSKRKILDIMENLQRGLFEGFVTGFSKMPPVIIYGEDRERRKAIAFYLPPFVEIHGDYAVLIDGIHRNSICHSAGTTMNSIHISKIGAPLPFDPIPWKQVKFVDEKPPIEERYVNLRKEYFRDLTAIGIDG